MTKETKIDERIQGYLDNQLTDEERAEFDAILAAQPATAREVEQLRAQDEAIRRFGEAVLREPVPERLMAIVRRATLLEIGNAAIEEGEPDADRVDEAHAIIIV